jgi:hypothetical protein
MAVQQHDRKGRLSQFTQRRHIAPLGVEQQTLHAVGMQGRQRLLLARLVIAGIAQHERIAMLLAGRLGAMQHGHRIGIEDVSHQHADEARATTLQAPCHLAGLIAQARNGLADLLAQAHRQRVELAAQVTRYAGLGHAGLPRNLRDGDPVVAGLGTLSHCCPPNQLNCVYRFVLHRVPGCSFI